jgi:hypothetical protein
MAKNDDLPTEPDEAFRKSFIGIIAHDIVLSKQRMGQDDNQANRRDFVRSTFAAVEGWLWDFRQRAQSVLKEVRDFSPAEQAAFAETSFTISSNGTLIEQTRYYSMTTMFRFIVRLAEEEFDNPLVDFGSNDWQAFNRAAEIRNRITHPKDINDFNLSESDIETVRSSSIWLLTTIAELRETLNIGLSAHVHAMREILSALNVGDPETLALYHTAQESGV